jgi:glycosyltransferase involved in cell wall biosynthesis
MPCKKNLQINRGLIHPMKEELPLVSIVTPSYNKGKFIEETILSIKTQTHPQIEHIIIDGGSTDDTINILKKYEGTYNMQWLSEPDEGQSDAINKGWRMAKGEILAYLNADDTYLPEAVETAAKFLLEHPDIMMVYGRCNIINESSEVIGQSPAKEFDWEDTLCRGGMIPQPTAFFRRKILHEIGYLNTNLHMSMDLDLWIRIGLKFKMKCIPKHLANFRLCLGTKSMDDAYKFGHEHLYILSKTFSNAELPKEVRALKRKAYSYAHLSIGVSYYKQRQIKQARRHFIRTITLYPGHLRKLFVIGVQWLHRSLGGTATEIACRWKLKLVGKLK